MGHRLVELRVRNLGVIDDVTVRPGPGMTALTGETGAGKTLLVQALSLLLGGHADPAVVRAGADEALIEGRFSLGDDQTDDPDDDRGPNPGEGDAHELVLARAVVRGGRSRAWIDGRMASRSALAERAGELLELHGQHEHRALTHVESQRRALDSFGPVDLTGLEAARRRLRRLLDASEAIGGDAKQRAREADLLRYQIDEIDAAAVEDAGEDGRLGAEEERLADAELCRSSAADALDAVSGADETSALGRLADASAALAGRGPMAPSEARVRAAMAELTDLAAELRTVVETWEADPDRLEAVRQRRQLFRQLERKYGDDLGEVLAFVADARSRLAALAADEARAHQLDVEVETARRELAAAEAVVAEARRRAAPRLASAIEATLRGLAMPAARFSITVEGDGPADRVTFLLGANPGEPAQPLAKVASGGELARTMLAVRLAVGGAPGVMTFDEVDAGIGGAAAIAVGSALAGLAPRAQVLVVTHLAQVAAQADHQIEVRKVEQDGRTRTEVEALDPEARVVEISRMLSGRPDSTSARRHARELLDGRPAGARAAPAGALGGP